MRCKVQGTRLRVHGKDSKFTQLEFPCTLYLEPYTLHLIPCTLNHLAYPNFLMSKKHEGMTYA
jgi:hypothetical protein